VRNDIARLRGSRFVSGVEAESGKQFSEVLIKRLTGDDKISARYLYKEFFEFEPTFKIFLAANHKPVITGTDHGIWRRIVLIPFTVKFEGASRDRKLKYKLEKELSGILKWAVDGCIEWQKSGLQIPDEIKAATNTYKNEMDTVGRFLSDYVINKPIQESLNMTFIEHMRDGQSKTPSIP
jgi:putative DNA primase/helicase